MPHDDIYANYHSLMSLPVVQQLHQELEQLRVENSRLRNVLVTSLEEKAGIHEKQQVKFIPASSARVSDSFPKAASNTNPNPVYQSLQNVFVKTEKDIYVCPKPIVNLSSETLQDNSIVDEVIVLEQKVFQEVQEVEEVEEVQELQELVEEEVQEVQEVVEEEEVVVDNTKHPVGCWVDRLWKEVEGEGEVEVSLMEVECVEYYVDNFDNVYEKLEDEDVGEYVGHLVTGPRNALQGGFEKVEEEEEEEVEVEEVEEEDENVEVAEIEGTNYFVTKGGSEGCSVYAYVSEEEPGDLVGYIREGSLVFA